MTASHVVLLVGLVATLALAPAATANGITQGNCVGSSLGNDNGYWICPTPNDPECAAYLVRETIWGTWETCLVPKP